MYILRINVTFQTCSFLCIKQFCIITFFRISYNLSEKWNLDIDFFQVLTYYNFLKFGLIKKCC